MTLTNLYYRQLPRGRHARGHLPYLVWSIHWKADDEDSCGKCVWIQIVFFSDISIYIFNYSIFCICFQRRSSFYPPPLGVHQGLFRTSNRYEQAPRTVSGQRSCTKEKEKLRTWNWKQVEIRFICELGFLPKRWPPDPCIFQGNSNAQGKFCWLLFR